MPKTVLLETNNSIATITFNRPAAMNTFNDEMAEELAQITNQVRLDTAIRAVLLKGGGPLFMAGGDIKFFHEHLQEMPKPVMKIVRNFAASINNFMRMPKPVLACVHGSVAGGGMSFMLACDLVIAAENTKFTTAYVGIGACPDGGITYNMPRHVGIKKAMELMLLSEIFDAQTAKALGLINWVTPETQLFAEAEKIVRRLAQGPTQTLAQVKKLLNQSHMNSLEMQMEAEGEGFEICSASQDFKNAVQAFVTKKKVK